MILLSLSRWRFRHLLVLIGVAGISVSCFAEHSFVPVNSTPYDKQMARVLPVLSSGTHYAPDPLLLMRINGWISDLYAIPYAYCPRWNTPAEVRSASFADCKGKAVALYANMKWYGATNVRVVIGKRRLGDLKTHAWLEWQTGNGKYLLDPTFNEIAPEATWTNPTTYIPFYAYDGAHKYRADNHRSSYPMAVAQSVTATNYAVSYRSISYAPASWNAAQSFSQSTDYARAQARRAAQIRTSRAYQSAPRKVASVQHHPVPRPTSLAGLPRKSVGGWQQLSAPNAIASTWR